MFRNTSKIGDDHRSTLVTWIVIVGGEFHDANGDFSGNWEDEAKEPVRRKIPPCFALSLFEDCIYFGMVLGLKLFRRHLSIIFLKVQACQ